MIHDILKGTGVALVTPFTREFAVDFDGIRKLLDFVMAGGVNYLVINGTTAESVTTTTAEKAEILSFIKKQVQGRVPLVYGLGGNNTYEVAASIAATDLEGITALLSVSPYYNRPSQEGIYQHYVHLAEVSPVPVILYNVPGRTGSNITAATTLRLAAHPNIAGIKEASANIEQCMLIAKNKPKDFMLISGDDLLTLPMMSFGATGVISVLANAFPEDFSKLVQAGLENDFKKASDLLFGLIHINPLMYEESNPVGVKVVLEHKGICTAAVRLPLVEASDDLRGRILRLL